MEEPTINCKVLIVIKQFTLKELLSHIKHGSTLHINSVNAHNSEVGGINISVF